MIQQYRLIVAASNQVPKTQPDAQPVEGAWFCRMLRRLTRLPLTFALTPKAWRRQLSQALATVSFGQFYELRRDDATASYEYRSLSARSKLPSTLFGQRLREARLRAGIPQDRLGVAIGLDETTASARISRYETGIHATPFEIAVQLAKVLGVPTPYLYCEDDELAAVILGWRGLSKTDRKRVRGLLDEMCSTGKHAPSIG